MYVHEPSSSRCTAAKQSVCSTSQRAPPARLQTNQPSARMPSRQLACWRATSSSSAAATCHAPSSRPWRPGYPCWPCRPCCLLQPSRPAAGAPGGAAWTPLSWRSRCYACTRWAPKKHSLCEMWIHDVYGASCRAAQGCRACTGQGMARSGSVLMFGAACCVTYCGVSCLQRPGPCSEQTRCEVRH